MTDCVWGGGGGGVKRRKFGEEYWRKGTNHEPNNRVRRIKESYKSDGV